MTRRKHRLPMSAPMVHAIRREIEQPGDGKTQTRRIVKRNAAGRVERAGRQWHIEGPDAVIASPYGQPGDLLAFTETFAFGAGYDELPPRAVPADRRIVRVWYRADGEQLSPSVYERCFGRGRWRQTRFMPYWCTRYTGVVTDVRLERVQEITEDGVRREGLRCDDRGWEYIGSHPIERPIPGRPGEWEPAVGWQTHDAAFAHLWDSIHGPGVWDRNDWVWVYTYRPIAANVLDVERDPAAYGLEGAA